MLFRKQNPFRKINITINYINLELPSKLVNEFNSMVKYDTIFSTIPIQKIFDLYLMGILSHVFFLVFLLFKIIGLILDFLKMSQF